MAKEKCEICNKEIDVCETALKLCDDCFDEKCICGHKRAWHIDNIGACVYTYSLNHKTKRGENCVCNEFAQD